MLFTDGFHILREISFYDDILIIFWSQMEMDSIANTSLNK